MFRPPIARTPAGDFRVSIGRRERAVLRSLPAALDRLLDEEPDDPDLRRLFPPAYADDEEAEAEYRRLMAGELLDGRRAALRTFAETLDADVLTADDLESWLRALNDLRLFLGTRLDVTEEDLVQPFDPREPKAEERALYAYLSWLQEHVVEALSD
jgi:Domain of unknown function (DUF2017)